MVHAFGAGELAELIVPLRGLAIGLHGLPGLGQGDRIGHRDAIFEEPGADGAGGADAARTPVDRALGQVLGEIDQTAIATFGSITVATMLKMIGRSG